MPPYRNPRKAVKSFRTGKHGLKFKRYSVPSLSAALRNRAPRAARGWYNRPGELKYKDTNFGGAATYKYDTVGTVVALNLIAVGDDNNTRDGRQITCKSVQVTGVIAPVDQTTSACLCRTMLVWDKSPNSGAAVATITDILYASYSTSMTNLDNRERFTILRDSKVAIGGINATAGTSTYAGAPTTSEIDWFVPLNGLKTTYSGTTNLIGSIGSGALLLVTIGSAAALDGCIGQLDARLRYYDN